MEFIWEVVFGGQEQGLEGGELGRVQAALVLPTTGPAGSHPLGPSESLMENTSQNVPPEDGERPDPWGSCSHVGSPTQGVPPWHSQAVCSGGTNSLET